MSARGRSRRTVQTVSTQRVAGIYVRISDDTEGEEEGVQRQEADCRELCEKLGILVYRIYADNDRGASTRSSNKPRPEYDRLLRDAKAGLINTIVAWTSGRVTRRPRENEDLIELAVDFGITFTYVKSPSFDLNTADGRQIARTLAANDAGEAERLGERVAREYRDRYREIGYGGGQRPYGFGVLSTRIVRGLEQQFIDYTLIREDECEEIRRAARTILSDRSGNTLAAIAADMRRRNVPTVTGAEWSAVCLRDVLLRPRNAGVIVLHGEEIGTMKGETILTRDVWEAICRKLKDPSRNTLPVGGAPHKWLGSGIYKCVCGSTMHVHLGAKTRTTPAYICSRKGGTGTTHVRRAVAPLDKHVIGRLMEILADRSTVKVTDATVDVDALRLQAQAQRVLLDEYAADRANGLITRSQFLAATELTQGKLDDFEAQLAAAMVLTPTSQFVSPLNPLADEADAYLRWQKMSLVDQRSLLREVLSVTVLPTTRSRGFRPESIEISEVHDNG